MPTPEEIIQSIDPARLVDYFGSSAVRDAESIIAPVVKDAAGAELTVRKALAVFLYFEAKKRNITPTMSVGDKAIIFDDPDAWSLVFAMTQQMDVAQVVGLEILELQSVIELAYARRCAGLGIAYEPIGEFVS